MTPTATQVPRSVFIRRSVALIPARYLPPPSRPSLATWSPTENANPQDTLRVTSLGIESLVGDWVASNRVIPYLRPRLINRMAHSAACLPYFGC